MTNTEGQRKGDGLLTTLARIDRTTIFLTALALGVIALFLPGVAGALLVLGIVGGLGAVLRLTWTHTPPAMRIVRVLVLAGFAAIALSKII